MLPNVQEKVRLGSERTGVLQALVVTFGASLRERYCFSRERQPSEPVPNHHTWPLASPTTFKSGQEREHWISQ
jgi:hypothetical protein